MLILLQVVMSHTNFTKVTRVVFIKVDSVMMQTTGITTTTRMLSVFANTTVAVTDVSTELPCLCFVVGQGVVLEYAELM